MLPGGSAWWPLAWLGAAVDAELIDRVSDPGEDHSAVADHHVRLDPKLAGLCIPRTPWRNHLLNARAASPDQPVPVLPSQLDVSSTLPSKAGSRTLCAPPAPRIRLNVCRRAADTASRRMDCLPRCSGRSAWAHKCTWRQRLPAHGER
jgi:hypothetical protein